MDDQTYESICALFDAFRTAALNILYYGDSRSALEESYRLPQGRIAKNLVHLRYGGLSDELARLQAMGVQPVDEAFIDTCDEELLTAHSCGSQFGRYRLAGVKGHVSGFAGYWLLRSAIALTMISACRHKA